MIYKTEFTEQEIKVFRDKYFKSIKAISLKIIMLKVVADLEEIRIKSLNNMQTNLQD